MPKDSLEKNILLVDDHALFRAGLRLILASKIKAAIHEIEKISDAKTLEIDIDVILLDVHLPGLNGIDGMSVLQQQWSDARIMLLSAASNHENINQALDQGASCFLNKNTDPALICKTVQSLLDNRSITNAQYALNTNSEIVTQAKPILSTRMLEVLALMAEGHSNKYIAEKLVLSENTIRNHAAALMEHFGVNNRTKMILAAQQAGYLSQ
ncbi:response regulator transcription factor [Psychrobacter sp. T6-1]|uniref:response regulator transcription factor n=1 Tax=Psychrobacter sp. T6-1 TaxID=3457447 RepID=UPI003FD051D6